MRHSLYKYYDKREWAEAFFDGKLRFHSLSYFRGHEEQAVRGDKNEGRLIFRPDEGLVVTNHTQGWTRTLPWSFNATANPDEIFVFCLSRSFTQALRQRFKAVACAEIVDIKSFCDRVERSLPHGAKLPGRPDREHIGQAVNYYEESDNCNPTWACPDMIAALKHKTFAWQDEYRLIFSITDALNFESARYSLVRNGASEQFKSTQSQHYDLDVGSLRDLCVLHEFDREQVPTG